MPTLYNKTILHFARFRFLSHTNFLGTHNTDSAPFMLIQAAVIAPDFRTFQLLSELTFYLITTNLARIYS